MSDGIAFRTPDPRPLAWGWMGVLALAGVLAAAFGAWSGRAAAFGATAWWVICAAPLALGAALAATSTADREQYAARGLAAALMAPIGLAMWSGTADGPAAGLGTWVLGVGALLLWLLAWLATLAWAASLTTRLDPAPGTAAVGLASLRRRLVALADAGAPLAVHGHHERHVEVALDVDPDGARAHHVHLFFDAGSRAVRVIERLGAHGAAPLAHEASFHRPGDARADASRPPVRRVHGRSRQTTILGADRLGRWPIRLRPDDSVGGLESRPAAWAGADAEERGRILVAMLASVVVGSGWSWRPRLLGRVRGR